jgi:hypothetical protein
MSMCISLFTVGITVPYISEFRELFEVATYIRSYHPYTSIEVVLSSATRDVPCCGNRDPLITGDDKSRKNHNFRHKNLLWCHFCYELHTRCYWRV